MTVILVPGTAQVKLSGTVSGNPWNCLWHFSIGSVEGPWTSAMIQALANTTFSAWKTSFQGLIGPNVTTLNAIAVDLSTETPATATSTGASFIGSSGSQGLIAGNAQMVNFHIGRRYRGGHPRTYLPPASTNLTTDEDHWVAAQITNVNAQFPVMVQAIESAVLTAGAAACAHVVPTYTYSYTDDPARHRYTHQKEDLAPGSPFIVTGYSMQPRICSQRRRLGPTS